MNREFTKEPKIKMAIKPIKICSCSLIIREMQIQSTLKYNFSPTRLDKIKNYDDNTNLFNETVGKLRALMHLRQKCKLIQLLENLAISNKTTYMFTF